MSNLIKLDNIGDLINKADYYGWPSNVIDVTGLSSEFQKAIIKFDIISVCEVFGYQIASAIGINVPKMQGFYTLSGRIGILVEYYSDWRYLSIDEAAERDPEVTASALALCAFDRFEWGEFGLSNNSVYFIDLERLFPPMIPELLLNESEEDRVIRLLQWERMYKGTFDLPYVLREANLIRLKNLVERKLEQLCALTPDRYCSILKITGYPHSTLLSRYVAHNFGFRLNEIARYFSLPTYEVPQWID
jgi:hypothetical protein